MISRMKENEHHRRHSSCSRRAKARGKWASRQLGKKRGAKNEQALSTESAEERKDKGKK